MVTPLGLSKRTTEPLTHFFTVSESPITVSERFGLVIATMVLLTSCARSSGWTGRLTVEPALFSEESHFAFRVAPHQSYYDSLLFSTLESVDASQLDPGKELLEGSE